MNDNDIVISRAIAEQAAGWIDRLVKECERHNEDYKYVTRARVLTDARLIETMLLEVLTSPQDNECARR